jgi:hypothetical protein
MKKSAVADFFLNLSLKAKDFTRTECGFHLTSARFHISPKAKYFTATAGSSAERDLRRRLKKPQAFEKA